MNVTDLTDAELAAAANEYFQRTVRRMRNNGLTKAMTVMLYSWVYADDYEISHDLNYKHYDDELKLKGGNLLELVDKHLVIAGISVTPPMKVTPMLSGPVIEDAEFTEAF